MKNTREKSASYWRHFLWRGLTVLMFFYLCADVTVLEYFGGNPNLGITSFRQIIEINPQPAKETKTSFAQNTIDASRSSKSDQDSDIPLDGDDCFCCSSHAVINYNFLIVPLLPVVARHFAPNFSNRRDHSDWHLPPSFRPPRIA